MGEELEKDGAQVDPSNPSNPSDWVDTHGDYLFRFAYLRVGSEGAAEELVQDTFVTALQGIEKFEGRSSVRTWLTGILKFKVLEFYRTRTARDQAVEFDESIHNFDLLGGWKVNPTNWGRSPDASLEAQQLVKQLGRCLTKLKEKWRVAFLLHVVDEVDAATICDRLQLSESNLWVILYRSRLSLRECLEKNWFRKTQ